jgi:hypothetical protein
MNATAKKILDMFVYQNKIFVHSTREVACAKEMAQLELFRLEEGTCIGVPGYWLSIHRVTT